MAEETKPLNLIQKLAAIRCELTHIEKKGKNEHFGYKFMRAEDVAGDIGDRFAKVNIVIGIENGRTEVHAMDKGFMVVTECTYKFIDGDSGESLTVWSCGAGYDSSDKGIYKARTGALKYALTQALCMRVGDDAEADGDDNARVKLPPASPELKQAAKDYNGSFKEATADGSVKATRIALIKKAKDKLGDELGLKWLKEAARDLGKTSDKLTIDEMIGLSERITKLAPLGAEPIKEEADLDW